MDVFRVCAYRRICIREVYGRGDGKWSWFGGLLVEGVIDVFFFDLFFFFFYVLRLLLSLFDSSLVSVFVWLLILWCECLVFFIIIVFGVFFFFFYSVDAIVYF